MNPNIGARDRAKLLDTLAFAVAHIEVARTELVNLLDGDDDDTHHLIEGLGSMREAMTEIEDALKQGVRMARLEAVPWSVIGKALDTSKQAVQQRYGPTVKVVRGVRRPDGSLV